jgi:hypothetical protein
MTHWLTEHGFTVSATGDLRRRVRHEAQHG